METRGVNEIHQVIIVYSCEEDMQMVSMKRLMTPIEEKSYL